MTTESQITAWLATQQDAMLALLRDMVDIDSGTFNKPGIDAVGGVIEGFLAGHGIPVERLPQSRHGDCLRACVGGGDGGGGGGGGDGGRGNARRNVLLLGHRDTVFPDGEAARRPFGVRDGIAYGPGVLDMKAGLAMNAFLLVAFHRFGGAPAPLVGLFTGDEEIGSPEGRAVIEAEARQARAVFNSEGGPISGNVVTGRKGAVFSKFTIAGRAAHSGSRFGDGISAIEELALKVHAIHGLTDLVRGITLNVGLVSGGQSVNTVAPWAEGQVDLRYVTPADRDEVMAGVAAIVAHSYVPGTRAELAVSGEFLPLTADAPARRLLDLYVAAAADTGFTTAGEFDGGCADSGFAAAAGAPTICSVGPLGGNAHRPDEFLRVDSLVPRAQACARAILRLDAAGL
jgi:glutamate carboxypeptidase